MKVTNRVLMLRKTFITGVFMAASAVLCASELPEATHIFTASLFDIPANQTSQPAAKTAKASSGSSSGDLAKQSQNPVADMVSLVFQNNTYFETGPKAKTQNVLLFQPVIPIHMNEDWNFIARPIIPFIN